MREVAIFRHQMFKVSEPFITQQAEQFRQFSPVYLGRKRFGEAPVGSKSLALTDMPEQRRISRRLWQVVTRDPRPYLRLLDQRRPALIHAHFGVEGVYALPLARRLDIPLVTTFHGFDATLSTKSLLASRSPSWMNYAVRRHQLARHGDIFLCVSEFIRQRVLELGFPEDQTHVHHIGIDTQSVQPRDPEGEKPIVLHVARLVEKKGTEYLIRAFVKISDDFPDVELVIIGDGPLRESLEKLVESFGLKSQVHFMGARPHAEVLSSMLKAALLAIPSVTALSGDTEGLPMAILEAASLGIPVVGTWHSGIPEAIVDGKTGFLVAERDTEALAERLHVLLADQGRRRAMGLEARAFCESRFDIRHQTSKLEAIYDRVVG
ncbi:glycosyltransferase [Halomonas garicola]|uniref:glycosyltransferase n=1 Tax=Halomonas garicola TaxID=1690008 RepID=UPI0028984F21|nr:glycosyltransferase [Halomonas garicola]